MSKITEAQLTEFCEKLKIFREETLTEPAQRALLDAILGFVWNATAREEALGFEGCFEPNQAELILAYSPTGPGVASGEVVALIPRMIKASAGGIKGPHLIK